MTMTIVSPAVSWPLPGNAQSQNTAVHQGTAPKPSNVFIDVPARVTVPVAPNGLPVLKLTPQPQAAKLVKNLLSIPEPSELSPLTDSNLFREHNITIPLEFEGVVEGSRIRAWANVQTGDVEIYPILGDMRPLSIENLDELKTKASTIFKTETFLQRDDTNIEVGNAILLKSETAERGVGITRRPDTYLAYYVAHRLVDGYRVYGVGSRALLALAGDGGVKGLIRSWKVATKTPEILHETRPPEKILTDIFAELNQIRGSDKITLENIELAYYDNNGDFLRPVYRFTAKINGRPNQLDNLVVGYAPYGKSGEQPPSVTSTLPTKLPCKDPPVSAASTNSGKDSSVSKLKVGRYITRTSRGSWIEDAKVFGDSLSFSDGSSGFADSQFYCAEPRLFTTEKKSFIDAMNIALLEADGGWWIFSTMLADPCRRTSYPSIQNCCSHDTSGRSCNGQDECTSGRNFCEAVNIASDVPVGGYGDRSKKNQLDLWIFHSCEVIPSPEDTSCWHSPWWPVFNGLRSVVGYRTAMSPSDLAGAAFGASLRQMATPINSSWLGDVISLSAYSPADTDATECGTCRPMGRPSAISPCDHQDDSLLSPAPSKPAKCLAIWWLSD